METRLYEIQGSEFYDEHVLSHSATGAPWYSSFSLETFYLPGKWQKLSFNCFHCVTNTHQDRISKGCFTCVPQPNPAEAKVDHLLLTIIFMTVFHKRSTSGG